MPNVKLNDNEHEVVARAAASLNVGVQAFAKDALIKAADALLDSTKPTQADTDLSDLQVTRAVEEERVPQKVEKPRKVTRKK